MDAVGAPHGRAGPNAPRGKADGFVTRHLADRYEIIGTLGSGGLARVLRVRDRAVAGRILALKQAHRAADAPELLAEFLALGRVQHPNLPTLHDFHEDLGEGRPGYTLDEVSGETADVHVERAGPGVLPDVLAGVLRALASIHSRGLAHGDVHPHNIIVDALGSTVKLLDLSPASERGAARGALPYQSPERLEGSPPSVAADLFAVGVTLHRLLCGELPFPDYPAVAREVAPVGAARLGPWRDLVCDLLRRRPAERPADAAAVLRAVATIAGRDLPLLDPAAVRAMLAHGPSVPVGDWPARLLDAAGGGPRGLPAVVVAIGPDGSGRSHALRAVRWRLQADGWRVLHAVATPSDTPGSLIRRLAAQLPVTERTSLPGLESAAAGGAVSHGADAPPEKARSRAAAALAHALTATARGLRLAILVDDSDRMDGFSAEVLLTVARTAEHRPADAGELVLVLAGRTGGLLGHLLAAAGTRGQALELPPFDEAATRALLGQVFLGRRPTLALVQALRRSGGSPLVLSEALTTALDQGWIRIGDQDVDIVPDAPSPLPVPQSVQEAQRARLSEVPAACWPLLTAIAAAPVPFPAGLAPRLLGPEAPARALDRLRELGVIRWGVESGDARLALATPSLAEAVRDRGEPGAPALTALADAPGSPGGLAARVIQIWAAALLDRGVDEELTAVADELVQSGHAEGALRLFSASPAPVNATSDLRWEVQGDAMAMLGRDDEALAAYAHLPAQTASVRTGTLLIRRGRNREAIERFSEAAALLQEGPAAPLAEALSWRARAYMLLGEYDNAMADCARARSAATGDLRARLLHTEGLVHYYKGEYDAAAKALAMARDHWAIQGRAVEEAEVANAIGLLHFRQSELDEATRIFEAVLETAERAGDRDRALVTLMNMAVIEQSRGAYGEAESRYREALSMARVLGHEAGIMKVTQNLGNLHRFLGELDEATRNLDEALPLAEADRNRYMVAHIRCLRGEIHWLRDDLEAAEAELLAARETFRDLGSAGEEADCTRSLAEVLLDRGALDAARREADRALELAESKGVPSIEVLCRATRAEVERRRESGNLEVALATADAAGQAATELDRPDITWQVQLTRHRLLRDLERSDEALAAANAALAALDRLTRELSETRRGTFLRVKNRRRAVRELRWLAALHPPEGGGTSWRRLLDVNQRLNSELDLAKLLEYIIDSAILLTGAERGFVLMIDEAKRATGTDGGLRVEVARNIDQENIRNKRMKVSYSIAQQVIETAEPVLTTDAMADGRYSEYLSIHHMKLRSVLCLPMVRQGRVIGALYIDNRFQSDAFDGDDLAFMEAFAAQAAIALGNARLLEERQRTLAALAATREQVEALNARLTNQLAEKERALQETEELLVVQRRQLSRAHGYESLVGDSQPLRQLLHVLDRVAKSEVSVLLTGESGTGKELVARAVHFNGPRKDRPFVAINCSSIPETLFESELFGHVRGAFTGATADKKGVFEVADRGTLFLDEIGELPLEMQAKLLRVLQDGAIQKVGSPRAAHVDVRIVAATNRNIRDMVAAKAFREDLFYRLAVVTMELPPLRDRVSDIPLLVHHFIQQNQREGIGGAVRGIHPDALRLLARYRWPGNVRELEMALKNASIFCEGDILRPADFSNFPEIVGAEDTEAAPAPLSTAVRPIADLERDAIVHALEVFGGNKKRTAERLGIDRRTLYNKLAAYGISVERRAQVLGRDA